MIQRKRFLLSVLMLCVFALGAGAELVKNEIVYAKLSALGEPQEVFVISAFEVDEEKEWVDYGKFREVQLLSSTEAFSYEEDQVIIKAKPGRVFYQGIPKDFYLPWQIHIDYKLDNKDISPQDLSGKSGKLEIDLIIKPIDGFEMYTEAMTLQVSLTLDGDLSYHVTAPKATMAWAGGNIALNFVVLPGQEAAYTIYADVVDFSMTPLQAAGVQMAMDTQMYKELASKALAGSPLEAAVGALMDNFLKSMQGGVSPSFTDERNKIESLQFVLMVEGVPKAEKTEDEPEVLEDNKTIFDRFLDLFGL